MTKMGDVLLQTAKYPVDQTFVHQNMRMLPEFKYHKYFTDEKVLSFLAYENYTDISRYLFMNKRLPHLADLWRYVYVWRNGGLYMDADDLVIRNFTLPKAVDALFMYDLSHKSIYNGFFWALPGDESLLSAAQFMKAHTHPRDHFHYNIRHLADILDLRLNIKLHAMNMSTPYEEFLDTRGKRVGILKWRTHLPSCMADNFGKIFLHVHGIRDPKQKCGAINILKPW